MRNKDIEQKIYEEFSEVKPEIFQSILDQCPKMQESPVKQTIWDYIGRLLNKKTFTYKVPDHFNGSIKIMAVASSKTGLGSVQVGSYSRGDFIISPTAPVFISPSDEVEIGVFDVVIDDILFLSSGKQIPADAVVREGTLEVNESLLTGESDPIIKQEGDTLYSGSYVISGHCYAQVTAIGKDIYIQKLTNQAKKYKKPQSELLSSLKIIIRIIGAIIIPVSAALVYIMYTNGEAYQTIVEKTSGAMIGMIPSGLFLLTSMALAVGVIRLAQNNTLVQELYCIEMLARVDTLCLDKTGTITDGTMTVKSIIEYKNDSGVALKNVVSAMLNAQNDTNLTSEALKERFGTAKRYRFKEIIPFSSSRKYSAVQFDRYGTFAIGAPEFVIKDGFSQIASEVEKQSLEGYRVLVVAHSDGEIIDNKLSFKDLKMILYKN